MKLYYIYDGNTTLGPFSLEDLKSHTLQKNTPIWYEALGEQWTTAGEVPELNTLFVPAPPPFREPAMAPVSKPAYTEHSVKVDSITAATSVPATSGRRYGWISIMTGVLMTGGIIWVTTNRENAKPDAYNNAVQSYYLDSALRTRGSSANDQLIAEMGEKKRKDSLLGIKNERLRNNWNESLTLQKTDANVNNNGYYEFDVKVVNYLEYIMDEVVVRVWLEDESGNIMEGKNITFRNIQPSDSKKQTYVIELADVAKYEAEIIRITSRSLHFCYNKDYDNPDGRRKSGERDPWFCK
jgi:GYF domain 2